MTDKNELAISFVSDFLSFFIGVPTGAAGELAKKAIVRRSEDKRNILIQEIRQGNIGPECVEDDEFVSCIWRIHMAITQGASAQNIKLLAKMIVGLVHDTDTVYADKFLHYSSVLEGLSYDELLTLSQIWNTYITLEYNPDEKEEKNDLSEEEREVAYKRNAAPNEAKKELVGKGKLFSNEDQFDSTLSGLTRTGLLIPVSAWGGILYKVSPKFEELMALIDCNLSDLCE